MASKIVEVTDDSTGVVLASFEADTTMNGVAVAMHGIWHSPELMERYVSIMNTLGQWLRDNAGVE